MQAAALEKVWLKTPHPSSASPPYHFLSPLPSRHIGCHSCLSQFFLAGRQDTDIAASGLSGTNVKVYFPAPTITLLDIWWQSHLEWWHENKHESRWELNCDCWIFLGYAQRHAGALHVFVIYPAPLDAFELMVQISQLDAGDQICSLHNVWLQPFELLTAEKTQQGQLSHHWMCSTNGSTMKNTCIHLKLPWFGLVV